MKCRLVATAGHVDHGKTALLEALTDQQTDRLREEQERGLTIDLGFADLSRGDLRIGFVDVPGHHNFIKNMVSGVGSVQGILFVVSAVDGWQEQSREHFEILRLLRPEACCFAVTKIDLADEELQLLVRAEIEEAVEKTPYEDAPILPVSAKTGQGVEELEERLVRLIGDTPQPPDEDKPYCPVDRVFTVKGQGTVVTGSLSGGGVHSGDELSLMPAGRPGNVRGIQQYHEAVDEAVPGSRVALNVPEWDADVATRGHIATLPAAGQNATVVDGLFEAPRFLDNPVKHDREILSYHATRRLKARLLTVDQRSFEPTQRGLVRLKWDRDVFVRPGDRVLLRDASDRNLLGIMRVGVVNPDRSLGNKEHREWLRRRFPVTPRSLLETDLERTGYGTLEALAEATPYRPESFRAVLDGVEEVLVLSGRYLVDQSWWRNRRQRIYDRVEEFHEEHPLQPGVPVSQVLEDVEDKGLRDELLRALTVEELERDGTHLRRRDFRPRLDPDQKQTYRTLLAEVEEGGLESPDRSGLIEQYDPELIEYALREGDLIELDDQRLIHADVLERIREGIQAYMEENQPCRLSDLRDYFGSSRKYVVPLMEYFDREGTTYRDGDLRHLRSRSET